MNYKIFDFETVHGPIEAEAKYQKSEASWWENNILLVFIALAMALLDTAFLFSMMDFVLEQNEGLGKVGAFGIALILNFLPLVIAKQINNARYGLDRHAKAFAIAGVITFGILYVGTVLLRFQCLELYTSSANKELENTAAFGIAAAVISPSGESSRRAIFTAVLLSIEPLATSAFSFAVDILTDNPLKKQINCLTTRLLELKAAHNRISTALASMLQDQELLIRYDQEQYEAARNRVVAEAERLKAESRMMLAERLGNPAAITTLAQDADINQSGIYDGSTENGLYAETKMKTPEKAVA